MVLFQEIVTTWTKQSRGGEGAVKRNAIPERLPLPSPLPFTEAQLTLLHQHIALSEDREFVPLERTEQRILVAGARETFEAVWMNVNEETCLLRYYWIESVGAPRRRQPPRQIAELQTGEWAQVKYNGRQGGRGEWTYRKTVYTIAVVTTFTEIEAVLAQPPSYAFSDMAELY